MPPKRQSQRHDAGDRDDMRERMIHNRSHGPGHRPASDACITRTPLHPPPTARPPRPSEDPRQPGRHTEARPPP